jgi:cell division protein FtsI (penicillin-binding protein 3)
MKQLKKIIPNLNYRKILKAINKRNKFTWIGRKIDLTKDQVKNIKKFKSILVETISSRLYPHHSLLAQTIGFVGIDNNGLAGTEYQFNKDLQGDPEIYKYFKDAKGRPIKFKSAKLEKPTKDIELSIDVDVQASLEEYLKEAVEKHEANRAGAAVMDAETGEILAIANYPTFDPNISRNRKSTKLAFVTDPFEPGSVFKTLTVASALENNLITADTNYYCEKGKYRVGNHYIKESDSKHAYEWLSVAEILKYSSNIGTTKIAFDLTYPVLKETLKKFRIGVKTSIEIPGESRGILEKKENIKPLRLSNISFGQGVATTGVQMLAAYAAFANGGYYVKPTILKVKDPSKIKKERIISEKTAKSITEMLVQVVEDGTGGRAKINHFTVAGKTSTAQRVDPKGGYKGYVPGFVGYPVNIDKRFIVFAYVDNPTKNGYYGNLVAAPIFQKITKNILYKNRKFNQLSHIKEDNHKTLDNIHIKYSSKRKIIKGIVPNLIGLDKGSAFKILDSIDVLYNHRGFGIVKSQWPEPGSSLEKNSVVKLKFSAPSYE